MTSRATPSRFIESNLHCGVGRYVCQLQRLVIKLCKTRQDSHGARDFIENKITDFAQKNPGVVVYISPRRFRTPELVGEYLTGYHKRVPIGDMDSEEISQWVQMLLTASGFPQQRLRKRWRTLNPTVQGIWNPFYHRATQFDFK